MDNMLSSLTGNTVQGVITFYDERDPDREDTVGAATTTGTSATAKGKEGQGSSKKVSASNKIKTLASVGDALGAIEDNALEKLGKNPKKVHRKRVYVQFNPSQIVLTSQGGGTSQITNYSRESKDANKENGSTSLIYGGVPPRIEVSIPLIFDEENNADCFLADKFQLSPTAIAKNMATLISGNVHSVQKQVEAFIASVRSDYLRLVTFSWADMAYTGNINQVDATYTMFSPEGNPVRATVKIRLLCVDKDVGEGRVGLWKDAFDAFYGDGSDQIRARKGQRVASFLNLG